MGQNFDGSFVVCAYPFEQTDAARTPAHINVQLEVQRLRKGLNSSAESVSQREFKIDKMDIDRSQVSRKINERVCSLHLHVSIPVAVNINVGVPDYISPFASDGVGFIFKTQRKRSLSVTRPACNPLSCEPISFDAGLRDGAPLYHVVEIQKGHWLS